MRRIPCVLPRILPWRLQFGQHVVAQPHRVKLAGLRKLHDFRDNQFGKRVFSIAVELQYIANRSKAARIASRSWGSPLNFENGMVSLDARITLARANAGLGPEATNRRWPRAALGREGGWHHAHPAGQDR
jgi:hypothetical protein